MAWYARIDENTNEFIRVESHDEMPEGFTDVLPVIASPKPLLYDWDKREYINQAMPEEQAEFERQIGINEMYNSRYTECDELSDTETLSSLNERYGSTDAFPDGPPRGFTAYSTTFNVAYTKTYGLAWTKL